MEVFSAILKLELILKYLFQVKFGLKILTSHLNTLNFVDEYTTNFTLEESFLSYKNYI